MDSVEQAAVLLFSMGEDQASQILKHMSPKQVEKLMSGINKLQGVQQEDIVKTLNQFFKDNSGDPAMHVDSDDYMRNALVSAVGSEKASSIIDKSLMGEKARGLEMLKWQPAKVIAELLQDEHMQVKIIALTYLDGGTAAEVIKRFPKEEHVELFERMTKIREISPVAIQDLSGELEAELSRMSNYKEIPIGGVDGVANIVNYFDSDMEHEVLTGLSAKDEELAAKIEDSMFPFEKLLAMDDKSLQTLLRDLASEDLVLALKGVDTISQQLIFKNMSTRAADMMKDDLESLGPTQLSKIQDAQKRIVGIAKDLGKEGKITIAGNSSGGGDDVVL